MKIIKSNDGNLFLCIKEIESIHENVLKCNDVDASFEKHVPQYEIHDDMVNVFVNHVMDEDHYIEWLLIDYGKKQIIEHFMPGDVPSVFVPYQEKMKAYSYCNKHSLWVNEDIKK